MANFNRVVKGLLINKRCFTNKLSPKLLEVGSNIQVSRKITNEDVEEFCRISSDTNSIHVGNNYKKAVVHGAFLNSLVSGVIGTKFPGPGTLVVSQNLNFPNKCFAGETVKITVTLIENRKIMKVNFLCEVEDENKIVLHGDAKLMMDNKSL